MKNRKIIHKILLAELLICTAFLIYSIVIDPFGEHDIMFALAITAGFIVWGKAKKKEPKSLCAEKYPETQKQRDRDCPIIKGQVFLDLS